MESTFNFDRSCHFLANLVRDGQNRLLRFIDGLLSSTDGDSRDCTIVRTLINVNLSIGVILDFIDGSSGFAKNASDRTRRYGELEYLVILLLKFNCLNKAESAL